MSKQIRVSDRAYEVIEREAKANHRSIIADQVDAMILGKKDGELILGGPTIDPTSKEGK